MAQARGGILDDVDQLMIAQTMPKSGFFDDSIPID